MASNLGHWKVELASWYSSVAGFYAVDLLGQAILVGLAPKDV
jgi:hypothetical protein